MLTVPPPAESWVFMKCRGYGKDEVESQQQTLCIMSIVQVLSLCKLNSDWTRNHCKEWSAWIFLFWNKILFGELRDFKKIISKWLGQNVNRSPVWTAWTTGSKLATPASHRQAAVSYGCSMRSAFLVSPLLIGRFPGCSHWAPQITQRPNGKGQWKWPRLPHYTSVECRRQDSGSRSRAVRS